MNTICGYSRRGSRRHLTVGFIPIDYYSSAVCRVAALFTTQYTFYIQAGARSRPPACRECRAVQQSLGWAVASLRRQVRTWCRLAGGCGVQRQQDNNNNNNNIYCRSIKVFVFSFILSAETLHRNPYNYNVQVVAIPAACTIILIYRSELNNF